jgi:methionine aminopeptidase
MISEEDLTKYNSSAKICGIVFREIVFKISNNEMLETNLLNEYGDRRILEECSKIYKREDKNIAFPTSISLNDCVGNYIYQENSNDYNMIKNGDVVKIELGVNIGGCIAVLGETIIYNSQGNQHNNSQENSSDKDYNKYLDLLNELSLSIPKMIIPGGLNDDVKIMIESKCTETGCFPVENSISYQHIDGQLVTDDSKYIITNYQKYYDDDDNLAVPENICFEFEPGEVYTINLTVIPNDYEKDDETQHEYYEPHESHIYRFNDNYYSLKLKMSREFCSESKNKHNTNAFNCLPYKKNARWRVGIKECLDNNILDEYPIIYNKDKLPVFHKKFTLVVSDNKCFELKYQNAKKSKV